MFYFSLKVDLSLKADLKSIIKQPNNSSILTDHTSTNHQVTITNNFKKTIQTCKNVTVVFKPTHV